MKLHAILVENFDCENTTGYVLDKKLFPSDETATKYMQENLERIKNDHWVKKAQENDDLEEDDNSDSGYYHANDGYNERTLDININQLEISTKDLINATRQSMLNDITNKLQEHVAGYSSARCALMDFRGTCISFDSEPDHKRLHVIAVCNVMCQDICIMMAEHNESEEPKKYYWAEFKNLNIFELKQIWEEVMKLSKENNNLWRKRAYNPYWLIGKAEKNILETINQPYEEYLKNINEE